MSKSTISTFQLFEMFPDQETARTYLENRRYAVAPIHTRFDALEWFVWDAEHPLSDLNHAEVIRQAETLEEALRGL